MAKKLYPLRSPDRRRNDKHIIITTSRQFSVRKDPMNPELKSYLPYSAFNRIESYFLERQGRQELPFHYYIRKVNNVWGIELGAPITVRSAMLDNAVSSGYLDSFYKDAIVVCIQDDYTTRVPDLETFALIGNKITAPLMRMLRMGSFNNVVNWYDEVFNIQKYERDVNVNLHTVEYDYEFRKMLYFDRVQFNLEARRF